MIDIEYVKRELEKFKKTGEEEARIDVVLMRYLEQLVAPPISPVRAVSIGITFTAPLAGIAAIPFVGDIFDFGGGTVLGRILDPFVEFLVYKPVYEALEKQYRYRELELYRALRGYEVCAYDDEYLIWDLVDMNYADEHTEAAMRLAKSERFENLSRDIRRFYLDDYRRLRALFFDKLRRVRYMLDGVIRLIEASREEIEEAQIREDIEELRIEIQEIRREIRELRRKPKG